MMQLCGRGHGLLAGLPREKGTAPLTCFFVQTNQEEKARASLLFEQAI